MLRVVASDFLNFFGNFVVVKNVKIPFRRSHMNRSRLALAKSAISLWKDFFVWYIPYSEFRVNYEYKCVTRNYWNSKTKDTLPWRHEALLHVRTRQEWIRRSDVFEKSQFNKEKIIWFYFFPIGINIWINVSLTWRSSVYRFTLRFYASRLYYKTFLFI